MQPAIEVVARDRNIIGEGPIWCEKEKVLFWVDIAGKLIWRLHPESGDQRSWELPDFVGCMALREKGGAVLGMRDGVYLFDFDSGSLDLFCRPDADFPENRANDGKCDREGRFWVGTMQNNIAPDGAPTEIDRWSGNLYCIRPDGSFTRQESGIGISNTLAWSGDDKTFYFGDSLARAIYAFDFDAEAGTIANKHDFARHESHGLPDGSAIDEAGYLWNARHDGSCLLRYAPDGGIASVIELPLRHPTSCCFGGDDLRTLYVTSLCHPLSEAEREAAPLEGGVLALRVDVPGTLSPRFAG